MTCITSQRKDLYKLFGYDRETEAMHVRHITGDESKTTAKALSLKQAAELIKTLCTNWAVFNIKDQQHRYILSLLRQIGWTTTSDRYGTIADMARLSNFLKSNKSPVPKPLQNMDKAETMKLINCLESMLGKKWDKQ